MSEGPGRPHSRQEGWGLSHCLTLIHPTFHTQKRTLLLLQNHLIPVYSVISSRYSPLYPHYGKGWWFVNLAANSNHQENCIKPSSQLNQNLGEGRQESTLFINKTPQVIPPCCRLRTTVGEKRSFFPNGSCFHSHF